MGRLQGRIGVFPQGHGRVHLEVGNVGVRLHRDCSRAAPATAGIVDQTVDPEVDHRLLRIIGRGDQHGGSRRARERRCRRPRPAPGWPAPVDFARTIGLPAARSRRAGSNCPGLAMVARAGRFSPAAVAPLPAAVRAARSRGLAASAASRSPPPRPRGPRRARPRAPAIARICFSRRLQSEPADAVLRARSAAQIPVDRLRPALQGATPRSASSSLRAITGGAPDRPACVSADGTTFARLEDDGIGPSGLAATAGAATPIRLQARVGDRLGLAAPSRRRAGSSARSGDCWRDGRAALAPVSSARQPGPAARSPARADGSARGGIEPARQGSARQRSGGKGLGCGGLSGGRLRQRRFRQGGLFAATGSGLRAAATGAA